MTRCPDDTASGKICRQNETSKPGGQKAPRTRKSSGAVAKFGVSGYFSHEKAGTWATSRVLPGVLALSLFLQTCKVDITSAARNWPERTAPTPTNTAAAIAGSQGSAMGRKRRGSRPRAGRRRFDLAPPFHHRGLRKPGYAYGGESPSQAAQLASPRQVFPRRCHPLRGAVPLCIHVAICLKHACICSHSCPDIYLL